jgi:hypothetical protein
MTIQEAVKAGARTLIVWRRQCGLEYDDELDAAASEPRLIWTFRHSEDGTVGDPGFSRLFERVRCAGGAPVARHQCEQHLRRQHSCNPPQYWMTNRLKFAEEITSLSIRHGFPSASAHLAPG